MCVEVLCVCVCGVSLVWFVFLVEFDPFSVYGVVGLERVKQCDEWMWR